MWLERRGAISAGALRSDALGQEKARCLKRRSWSCPWVGASVLEGAGLLLPAWSSCPADANNLMGHNTRQDVPKAVRKGNRLRSLDSRVQAQTSRGANLRRAQVLLSGFKPATAAPSPPSRLPPCTQHLSFIRRPIAELSPLPDNLCLRAESHFHGHPKSSALSASSVRMPQVALGGCSLSAFGDASPLPGGDHRESGAGEGVSLVFSLLSSPNLLRF